MMMPDITKQIEDIETDEGHVKNMSQGGGDCGHLKAG